MLAIFEELRHVIFFLIPIGEKVYMASTNFYSYLYSINADAAVALDEVADKINVTDPKEVQAAFEIYLKEEPLPIDIREELMEEKFYESPNEGKNGDETYIRYEMVIPGYKGNLEVEELKEYFERFFETIKNENETTLNYEVDVYTTDDERGYIDININLNLIQE